jgi:murein DD-endopeptidase MepM/ murein hydrolase activator NlpD
MRREKVWRAAAREILCFISDRRIIIQTVLAALFVPAAALLCLDQKLPYEPLERPLYSPKGWPGDWVMMLKSPIPSVTGNDGSGSGQPLGGQSYTLPPLSIVSYRVKPGDTLEKIASRLGLDTDTLSSLNRPGGSGVHILSIGEKIKIPNQDGIYIPVNENLDALCVKYDLTPEEVLAVNSLSKEGPAKGTPLFFPGAKHEGYALSLSLGVAIASPLHGWLSSPFGLRMDPFTGEWSRHRGIDIAAPEGSLVRSASDGAVIEASYNDVLGNFVEVRSPMGFLYVYGHFSAILTAKGARVAQGSALGRVGSTGHATGPHLHLEVWKNGVLQNPLKYLPGIR